MKRKKIIPAILLFLALTTVSISNAQKNGNVTPFRRGSVTANVAVGIGVDYKGDYRYYNSGNGFGTKAALEFGIWQAGPGVISLGPEVGGTFSNGGNGRYNDFRSRTVVIAGRSAWHYGWQVPGLDTYAGLSAGAGFHHYDYNDDYDDKHRDHDDVIPVFGGFIGASYFISSRFGVNIEAGYDITSLQAGVIFKLR
jgi:hypothetical protein